MSNLKFVLSALLVCLMAIPVRSYADDIVCGGQITMTMADHPACSGNLAFKTEASGDKWMCTKTSAAGALLITAMSTGRFVGVWIEGSDVASCTALPHYRQISYVIMYP